MLQAFKSKSVQSFVNAVQMLDKVNPLDTWTTRLLLNVRQQLQQIVENEDQT